ncbi:MAG: hypothetical protein ACOC97_03155 [Myxococcota bacterium]
MLQVLSLGVLLPAAVAAGVVLAASRGSAFRGGAMVAVAVAAGYVAAHLGVGGWHGAFPVDVTHRLPAVVLLTGALGLVALGERPGRRRFGPVLAAPVVAYALFEPLLGEPVSTVILLVAGGAAALAVHGALWSEALREAPSPLSCLALAVTAAGLGVASAVSGSILLGQLAGGLAAAAGGVAVAAPLARARPGLGPAGAVGGVALGGLAVLVSAYSATPPEALIPLALVPVAVWGLRRAIGGRGRPLAAVAAQVLAALLLSGAAAVWAAMPAADDADTGGAYDYGYR